MIRLHHVPLSRSFRVLWLLEELGLDFDVQHYSIRDGSLRDPAYLAISPLGRVPALELGDEVICESTAIVQSLCERHPEAGLAPAPGEAERTRYLEMMSFAETMASLIELLNMSHLFLRDPAQASPTVTKITTARLKATLSAFDQILGDRAYVLEGGFSAADIMVVSNLLLTKYFVDHAHFPRLRAYHTRLGERAAYQRAWTRNGQQDMYTKAFYPVPEG